MSVLKVFLSSTGKDLPQYREAAYRAIEELDGYHCVRMEDFGARDAASDAFCRQRVAETDIFVGILGHCYGGSPVGSDKSYTLQEYEAAVHTGKPRLMFVASDAFPLPAHLIEPDVLRTRQQAFRKRVDTERIRDTFVSPDDLARRVVQAIHNWKREPGEIARELFGGRIRLVSDDLFRQPASVDAVKRFYEGGPLTWNIVAAGAIIERDQQQGLFERLSTPADQTRMVCLVGESGAGKSSLAWQLAYELSLRQANPILQVLDNADDDIWYRLVDYWSRVHQPFCVLADDIFREDTAVRALKALDPNLPVTVLSTSRANEYRGDERLPFSVERVDLFEPSPAEKARILNRLDKEWSCLTGEQRARVGAANQFLVLMWELTAGKELVEIIRDTLDMLREQDEVVFRAYEYLCNVCQYQPTMPDSLLQRMDERGRFYRLTDKKSAQGLIFTDEQQPGYLNVGHPLRASHAVRLYGRDPCVVIGEILRQGDRENFNERRFLGNLLREMAQHDDKVKAITVLERHTALIEDIQRKATIREMLTWRALYQALGRHRDARRCMDMSFEKEPVSGIDCTYLLGFSRESGRENIVLPVFERWLKSNPEDKHARSAYLGLVERHAADQVLKVILETHNWLTDHPDDSSVRIPYFGLAEREGTAEQIAQVLAETSAWLANHPDDSFVRTRYLGLVGHKGTAVQIAEALSATRAWLSNHPEDSSVRTAYLGLAKREGTAEHIAEALSATRAWLGDHPEDSSVRTAYLGLVGRNGTVEQVAEALSATEYWLRDHPQDSNVRTAYLGLVKRKGTTKQITRALSTIKAWLDDHPHDSGVSTAYLGLITEQQAAGQEVIIVEQSQHELAARSQLEDTPGLLEQGQLLIETKQFHEAEELFRAATSKNQSNATARRGLALALNGLGHFEAAETEFRQSLAWAEAAGQPLGVFYHDLGHFYLEQGRYYRARGPFERAIAESPEEFANYWGLGRALLGQGKHKEAVIALEAALERIPQNLAPSPEEEILAQIVECQKLQAD